MGGISASDYYGINQPLTAELTNKGIRTIVAIYNQQDVFYGYAYEAIVTGFVAEIQFRVGIVNQTFAGIDFVRHSEHATLGGVIINALRQNLAGRPANLSGVQAAFIAAVVTRSAGSVTYDRIIPAIEAMTLHYSANID
jgi:hypothetical protein